MALRSTVSPTLDFYPKLELMDEKFIKEIVENTVDWAHQAHGMVMRTRKAPNRSDICQSAPCTLFPSPFPSNLFQEAIDIQQAFSLLYFRVSWDFDFLIKAHVEVIKTDEFTRHLVEILKDVWDAGIWQKKTLLIQRNDYMCHEDVHGNRFLKQIEVNNIAASMGSLAALTSCMHRRLLETMRIPKDIIKIAVPENRAVDTISEGIFEAWRDYGMNEAVVLFVVEDVSQNQIDQRHIEYRLENISNRRTRCLRITLTDGAERLTVAENHHLLLDNKFHVAVVYFRAGYSPEHYQTAREWITRRNIELSDAIKCPWIGLQLANTKKVQQLLSEKGILEKYITDDRLCERIKKTFAGLWSLENDDIETRKIINNAIADPEKFVLKPQLEGGAGNYYGQEVAEQLKTMNKEEIAALTLMERITPMVVKNYLIRPEEEPVMVDIVGELGIYAYVYGSPAIGTSQEEVITNHVGGHIVRSKGKNVDKGGIAIGAAVVDSPYLF
ncbi:unnamed protein product [Thelazia callipaeda]|uniref:Glutathione synthetase n=1 Tax=Thelazia callipaeda TaxID=103827 RepID=A0A0N5CMA0_THECL|nr:unnamed protein product [Thelazia callipaeda]